MAGAPASSSRANVSSSRARPCRCDAAALCTRRSRVPCSLLRPRRAACSRCSRPWRLHRLRGAAALECHGRRMHRARCAVRPRHASVAAASMHTAPRRQAEARGGSECGACNLPRLPTVQPAPSHSQRRCGGKVRAQMDAACTRACSFSKMSARVSVREHMCTRISRAHFKSTCIRCAVLHHVCRACFRHPPAPASVLSNETYTLHIPVTIGTWGSWIFVRPAGSPVFYLPN